MKFSIISIILLLFVCQPHYTLQSTPALVIYAYEDLLTYPPYNFTRQFEIDHGLPEGSVLLIRYDDSALREVIQSQTLSPSPDIVVGLDNIDEYFLTQNNLFLAYTSPRAVNISASLLAQSTNNLIPFDYGRITLVANTTKVGGSINLSTLTLDSIRNRPDILRKFAVQDPTSSETGLGFLLETVLTFGDDVNGITGRISGSGDWRQWWNATIKYLNVYSGWSESLAAFDDDSSPINLVVSYELDPAYYYCTENRTDIVTLGLGDNTWVYVDTLGIYHTTKNLSLAQKFVDWWLGPQIQSIIPNHEWTFPAVSSTELPSCFAGSSATPNPNFKELLSDTAVKQNLKYWLDQWSLIRAHSLANTTTTTTSTTSEGTYLVRSVGVLVLGIVLLLV